jgi:hypothetical protein
MNVATVLSFLTDGRIIAMVSTLGTSVSFFVVINYAFHTF